MQLQENVSLKLLNTFRVKAIARYFGEFRSTDELLAILSDKHATAKKLVLGGGSNVLFTSDFDGLILKNNITGIQKVHEDNDHIYVQAGAGENWHRFVSYCIEKGWAGIENLSLIPGNVGASPMQNIGA